MEKDDFLREIDELLGDIEDESPPPDHSIVNGSSTQDTGDTDDPDLKLANSLNSISHKHLKEPVVQEPPPKTG